MKKKIENNNKVKQKYLFPKSLCSLMMSSCSSQEKFSLGMVGLR